MTGKGNVALYLITCSYIGIPSTSLFTVPDLCQEKNFIAVLIHLQALAYFAALQAGYKGPPLSMFTTSDESTQVQQLFTFFSNDFSERFTRVGK